MTRLVLFELFVTNLRLFVSWQFSGPYGVTKYGSGWRKVVVNQSLEFEDPSDLRHTLLHPFHLHLYFHDAFDFYVRSLMLRHFTDLELKLFITFTKGNESVRNINPFIAPAVKISRLKDARTRLQTVYFPI